MGGSFKPPPMHSPRACHPIPHRPLPIEQAFPIHSCRRIRRSRCHRETPTARRSSCQHPTTQRQISAIIPKVRSRIANSLRTIPNGRLRTRPLPPLERPPLRESYSRNLENGTPRSPIHIRKTQQSGFQRQASRCSFHPSKPGRQSRSMDPDPKSSWLHSTQARERRNPAALCIQPFLWRTPMFFHSLQHLPDSTNTATVQTNSKATSTRSHRSCMLPPSRPIQEHRFLIQALPYLPKSGIPRCLQAQLRLSTRPQAGKASPSLLPRFSIMPPFPPTEHPLTESEIRRQILATWIPQSNLKRFPRQLRDPQSGLGLRKIPHLVKAPWKPIRFRIPDHLGQPALRIPMTSRHRARPRQANAPPRLAFLEPRQVRAKMRSRSLAILDSRLHSWMHPVRHFPGKTGILPRIQNPASRFGQRKRNHPRERSELAQTGSPKLPSRLPSTTTDSTAMDVSSRRIPTVDRRISTILFPDLIQHPYRIPKTVRRTNR